MKTTAKKSARVLGTQTPVVAQATSPERESFIVKSYGFNPRELEQEFREARKAEQAGRPLRHLLSEAAERGQEILASLETNKRDFSYWVAEIANYAEQAAAQRRQDLYNEALERCKRLRRNLERWGADRDYIEESTANQLLDDLEAIEERVKYAYKVAFAELQGQEAQNGYFEAHCLEWAKKGYERGHVRHAMSLKNYLLANKKTISKEVCMTQLEFVGQLTNNFCKKLWKTIR